MKKQLLILKVRQQAVKVVMKVYKLTEDFPEGEKSDLVYKINTAAISIPKSICEGVLKKSVKESSELFKKAMNRCYEIEDNLRLANTFECLNGKVYKSLTEEIVQLKKLIADVQQTLRHESETVRELVK